MHNMIIEDERDYNLSSLLEPMCIGITHRNLIFEEYLQGQIEIQNIPEFSIKERIHRTIMEFEREFIALRLL